MSDDTCISDGCGNKQNRHGRGFCQRHYLQALANGSLVRLQDLRPRQCTVEGCEGRPAGRGYCGTHWARWRSHGDPTVIARKPKSFCKVEEGCGKPVVSHGRCAKHDARFRANGTVTLPGRGAVLDGRAARDPFERFGQCIDTSAGPDGCHPWTGLRDPDGYGIFNNSGGTRRAPRWLLGHLRGAPLRRGEWALHRCDNPPCVNPAHLYVGDPKQNMQDKIERGRHRTRKKTHCSSGHELTPDNVKVIGRKRHCLTCEEFEAQRFEEARRHRESAEEIPGAA